MSKDDKNIPVLSLRVLIHFSDISTLLYLAIKGSTSKLFSSTTGSGKIFLVDEISRNIMVKFLTGNW